MATPQLTQHLSELLLDPRETLEVEFKGWIDIVNNTDHKAVLAKAIIALANHGGGVTIIGFERAGNAMIPAQSRPENLAGYTPDTVNAVVNRYAEPAFHCDMRIVSAQDSSDTYPIIIVPGGHRVPIRAKRDGSDRQTLQQNTYYIRRPGPQSESPQSAQEWDTLMRRCLSNAREELFNGFRFLMEGAPAPLAETDLDRVRRWFDASKTRWKELAEELPAGHGARLEDGYYAVGFEVVGDIERHSGAALLELLRAGVVRHSGWSPFWVPTRAGIEPYIYGGNVECWLGPNSKFRDPAHSDFWRVSDQGQFFLIRGYQEDGEEIKHSRPGKLFDVTLPTWRLGEILLYAASMARQFGVPQAEVVLVAEWTGLTGREVTHLSGIRLVSDGHVARQDSYSTSLAIQADQIGDLLPELVHRAVHPLYELFDFLQLPITLVTQELARMRASQF
jgi:transcriptional regulator with XRE-family HTH domain